jgi:hypothetical protein
MEGQGTANRKAQDSAEEEEAQHDVTNDTVLGVSFIFSMRHPNKNPGNPKNHLHCHAVKQRIKISKLNPKRLFFVENLNVHKLPPHCTGTLVAYCCVPVVNEDNNPVKKVQWYLGSIIFHSYEKTVIAPITVNNTLWKGGVVDLSMEWRSCMSILLDNCLEFETGQFQIRYLNSVQRITTENNQQVVSMLVSGPDNLYITKAMRNKAKCFVRNHVPLIPDGALPVPVNEIGRSSLLDILHKYKRGIPDSSLLHRRVKRKTMAAAGTHVVEIEGPMQYLRCGINPKTFLIPVLVPDKSIDCQGCSFPQRYVYFPRKCYRKLALKGRTNTLSFNEKNCWKKA